MDKTQINAKIREKQKAIDDFEDDIKQLKKKLDDLDDLLDKVTKLKNSVSDSQSARLKKIGEMECITANSRITSPYSSGMRNLVKTKSSNALSGLDDAKKRIGKKTDSIEEEIKTIKKKISRLEDEIDDLKAQLRR